MRVQGRSLPLGETRIYPHNLQFDLSRLFSDPKFLPETRPLDNRTAFIAGLNLACGGPLFQDVESFLRIYSLCKKQSLEKTVSQYEQNVLKLAPINRIVYHEVKGAWFNLSMEDWWNVERYETCAQKILDVVQRRRGGGANGDGHMFVTMTRREDRTAGLAALRRVGRDEWEVLESGGAGASEPFSVADGKRLKGWAKQWHDMEVFVLEREPPKQKKNGKGKSENAALRWLQVLFGQEP